MPVVSRRPRRPAALAVLAAVLLPVLAGCGADEAPAGDAAGWLPDVAAARGLHLGVDRARVRDFFMPESLAAGCALFDCDGDGDLDAYLVNGFRGADGRIDPERGANRLFRQGPDGRFEDVTGASGLGDGGYGMGVAVGDCDNDGDLDVYVTNYGPDRLYRNRGDGTFEDVTEAAGLRNEAWGASAGFFDYDGDGDLDLFVTNYLVYDPAAIVGTDRAGRPEYPGPERLPGLPDRLFRNEGEGRFADVSAASGIAGRRGRGLGLCFTDLDGDGRTDVYVANDREPNAAWINQGDGTFADRALRLGLARNEMGRPEASMGVALGDVDGDGRRDLLLTHLATETHTLYRNVGRGAWEDETASRGLGAPTRNDTGWGTALEDLDHDGDPDLVVVNGRVVRGSPHPGGAGLSRHWAGYAEPDRVFWNDGTGRFEEAGPEGAALNALVEVGRGLCAGDVDGDGDQDVLVTTANGTVRLFDNRVPKRGRWLRVRAVDPALRRDAVGAVVRVRAGGRERVRGITHTTSYLCSADATAHFGLGEVPGIDAVVVHWPGGGTERFGPFAPDRTVVVERGSGREER